MTKVIIEKGTNIIKYIAGINNESDFVQLNNAITVVDENNNLLYIINDLNESNSDIIELDITPSDYKNGEYKHENGKITKLPAKEVIKPIK